MSDNRDVALAALRSYDVAPQRVRLAAESFNSVFRVTTASAVYALRVGSVLQIHPEGTAAVETAWLRRLRLQGESVPDVVTNIDGDARDAGGQATGPSISPGCASCSNGSPGVPCGPA